MAQRQILPRDLDSPSLNDQCHELWVGYLCDTADGKYDHNSQVRSRVKASLRDDPQSQNIEKEKDIDALLAKAIETFIFDITLQARTLAETEAIQHGADPNEPVPLTLEHIKLVIQHAPHFDFLLPFFEPCPPSSQLQ